MPASRRRLIPAITEPARRLAARTVVVSLLALAALAGVLLPATEARAAATPAFVQTASNEVGSGTTNSVPFASANGAGNLIVAYVVWNNTGAASMSDSRGNAYASAGARQTWGGTWSSQVFYAKNVAAGANTVTATFGTSINGWGVVYIHEYSGVHTVSPLDVSGVATGGSSGMTASVLTTNANDLLFSAGASSVTVTAGGAGFTTRSSAFGNRTQDRNVTSAGAYSAAMTQNGGAWVSHLVAFKADAGTGDTTLPTVSITSPTNNADVSNIVNVMADASDDVGVTRVQFQVDGVDAGPPDTDAPYALAWDTRTAANGAHTLRAKAFDAAGNSQLSAAINVNVRNSSSFQNEVLATGFDLPTAIKFLPDGRMLVAELQGKIKILPPPYTNPDPGLFLQLTNIGVAGVQQGIYDLVLDPNFNINHYYYVFYTLGTPNRDRLSRFTANAMLSGTVPGSELVLYQDGQDANAEHHGGALNFGNDGKLYFTTGEHFIPDTSQMLTSPRGKIHRINPDGTVPTDNPFYDGSGPNVDSIWALGLRNPYRASYDAPTGRLFIGDVGGNDNSTAMEEINIGARGANYGWPNVEGPCAAPCTSPIHSWPHAGRDSAVTGGFVYRGSQFPSGFVGSYFFADYTQNYIKRLTLDANGNVTGVFNFEPADGHPDGPYGDIVYLTQGPEGALYYVDLGYSDISGTFGVSKIRRIRYNAGNQAPSASAAANPTFGPSPLQVSFSSAGTSDPEGDALTYSWVFGDGGTSTAANPVHTYGQAGVYTARLTVSDGTSNTVSTPLTITVGGAPTASIITPQDNSTFRAGDVISFSGDGTDPDDGNLPASAFTWNVDFLHEGHVHPGVVQTGTESGTFTIPTVGHDFEGNTRYRITLTVKDSDGLTDTKSVLIFPEKVNLSFSTVPAGMTVYLDGVAKTTPFVYDTVIGFNHTIEARDQTFGGTNYTFDSWSDGGAQTHGIVAPTTDRSFTATFKAAASPPTPPAFVQTAAKEVNSGTTNAVAFPNANAAGNLVVAYVIWNNTGAVSLSDNRGNSYASAGARQTWGGTWSSQVFYAKNVAAGANTVTATFANALNGWGAVYVHEYSGVDKVSPLDVSGVATGSSSGMNASVTTTNASDLLFSAGASSNTVTAGGTGFTTRSSAFGNRTQDRNVTAAGSYSAAMTQNGNRWVSHLVAFKADSGVADTTAPSVSVTAPANNASVSGSVNVTADASDNVGVNRVQFQVDGVDTGAPDTAAPYALAWDSRSVANGAHTLRARAFDAAGNSQLSAPIAVVVANSSNPPTASILSPQGGSTFRAGDVISFSGDANDAEDGALPASAYKWNIDLLHDDHEHAGPEQTGVKSGTFTIPSTGHDFSGNTRYRITITVTDSSGLTATKSVLIDPQKVILNFGTAPSGITLYLDGVAKSTPFQYDTLIGFKHTVEARNGSVGGTDYTFSAWSDGGAQTHTITVPSTNQSYTATYQAAATPPATPAFVQTAAREVNSGTTNPVAFPNANAAGNLIVAYVIWNNTGTASLSDSRGNSYASAGARQTWGGTWSSQVFYAKNIAAGANTVTATFATALNGWGVVYIHEYSGIDKVSPLDVSGVATGSSSAMTASAVTTNANDLLFSAGGSSVTVTAGGTGYTTRSTAFGNRTQDRNVTSTGSYSGAMTQNGSAWVSHLVAFKAQSGT